MRDRALQTVTGPNQPLPCLCKRRLQTKSHRRHGAICRGGCYLFSSEIPDTHELGWLRAHAGSIICTKHTGCIAEQRMKVSGLPLVVLALGLCSGSVLAQLGTAFTYQGRLDDGGQPKNGTVDLRFDAFDIDTGSLPVNAAPLILDAVPLSNGVFTVTVDFGAGVFGGNPIFLEIGVREDAAGVAGDPNGFTLLAPRQPVSPAPYAMHADRMALNAISGSNVVNGSLTATDVNTTSTTSGLQRRVNATCGSSQAMSAVGSDGTPTCVAFGDITAVSTVSGSGLSGGTSSGDVALSIDTDVTQSRISGRCESGKAVISAVLENGSVDCTYIDSPTPNTPIVLDSVGDVGSHLSVRQEGITGVLPGVAYYDATNQRLKYVHCDTQNCTTVDPPVILDDPANNVGQFPSVKFISPNLGVAYYDTTADDLKLALCSNFDCTGTVSVRILDSTGDVGRNAAIMSVANRFAVAYFDNTNNNYKYVRCNDAACSAPVPRTLTGLGGGGTLISTVASVRDQNLTLPEFLVLKDGSEVRLVRCSDVDCAAFTTVLVSSSTDVGVPMAMMRATISGAVHRWFTYARPGAGSISLRTCQGEACAVVSGMGGTIFNNPVASVFAMRDSLMPIYLQTRSSTETLVHSLPFSTLTSTGNTNTLSGSATAQGAMDAFKAVNLGPAVVYYETGGQNLVLLSCVREDCTEL